MPKQTTWKKALMRFLFPAELTKTQEAYDEKSEAHGKSNKSLTDELWKLKRQNEDLRLNEGRRLSYIKKIKDGTALELKEAECVHLKRNLQLALKKINEPYFMETILRQGAVIEKLNRDVSVLQDSRETLIQIAKRHGEDVQPVHTDENMYGPDGSNLSALYG